MKKLLFAVAVSLSLGCRDNTSPDATVAVSLAVSAQSFQARTPITLTLTLFNPGEETVQIRFTTCDRPFEVLDLSGRVVGPAPFQACPLAILVPLDIEPGKSKDYVVAWSGDASFGPTNELQFLPPANYRIRAQVPVGNNQFAYSDPIDITVTAAQ
jgi:hypothetical protein